MFIIFLFFQMFDPSELRSLSLDSDFEIRFGELSRSTCDIKEVQ